MEDRSVNGSSGRKRAIDIDSSDDLDDLVGQICSRLTNLETTDKIGHLDAFIEVLECTLNEATFFLESASWDISTAVGLYLEEQQYGKRRATDAARILECGPISIPTPCFGRVPRFEARPVAIDGMPEGWSAAVSPYSGQIAFFHQDTMSKQYIVPPGFAPLVNFDMDASATSLLFTENDVNDVVTPALVSAFDDGDNDSDTAVDGRLLDENNPENMSQGNDEDVGEA